MQFLPAALQNLSDQFARLLGIGGMILSPVLTVAAVQLLRPGEVK